MGAETVVYVKIVKEVVSWIEVQATSLDEAIAIAKESQDTVRVIHAQYDEPYTETSNGS